MLEQLFSDVICTYQIGCEILSFSCPALDTTICISYCQNSLVKVCFNFILLLIDSLASNAGFTLYATFVCY